jgi:hypothetical protein
VLLHAGLPGHGVALIAIYGSSRLLPQFNRADTGFFPERHSLWHLQPAEPLA